MNFSGNLYGTITAIDALGSQYLYNRIKEEYESIQPGNPFLLIGPSRAILACDPILIQANLIDKDSDLPLVSRGWIEWNPYRSYSEHGKSLLGEVKGKKDPCSLEVNYMVSSDAAQATVKVTLIIRDGGRLCRPCLWNDYCSQFQLF